MNTTTTASLLRKECIHVHAVPTVWILTALALFVASSEHTFGHDNNPKGTLAKAIAPKAAPLGMFSKREFKMVEFITSEGIATGFGVLFTNKSGESRIATVAKNFPRSRREAYYSYRILEDASEQCYPIKGYIPVLTMEYVQPEGSTTIFTRSSVTDLIICVPGTAAPIKGYSKGSEQEESKETIVIRRSTKVTSLRTGEMHESPVIITTLQKITLRAVKCGSASPGEGFVGQNGELFICSSFGPVTVKSSAGPEGSFVLVVELENLEEVP